MGTFSCIGELHLTCYSHMSALTVCVLWPSPLLYFGSGIHFNFFLLELT
jgi:hypothetical protein